MEVANENTLMSTPILAFALKMYCRNVPGGPASDSIASSVCGCARVYQITRPFSNYYSSLVSSREGRVVVNQRVSVKEFGF